jgi:hypothetical protein
MRVVERGRSKGAVRMIACTKGWNGRKTEAVLHTLRNELQRFPTGRELAEKGRGGEVRREGKRRKGEMLLTVGERSQRRGGENAL